ncbi:Efflux transporter, RND family, MFP subunit [Verrucomicrobia bacterium]|nr:Efflux transporter, RND family, MFP subunit [Verrucomicrobiota bacterium]
MDQTTVKSPQALPGAAAPTAAGPTNKPGEDKLEGSSNSASRLRRAALVAVVLIIVGAMAGLLPRWHRANRLRAETADLAVPTVAVVKAGPGKTAAGLSLPAEARPYLEAPIYARASGYLKRFVVDIGSRVKEGDLLAEIDTPELNQELAQARAQLTQADAALALAKITAARWAELLKTASVSEQEDAEKQADLQLKEATVEAQRANVRRLEELQSFAKVVAPFAGIITARETDVGQLIAATSGKELFRLAQTETLRVYVRVPQSAAREVAVGQLAELTIPELPGKVFTAKVVRSSGAMSMESRTLLTELQVDNARCEILPGTYVQVRFAQAHDEASLTLPANTLLFRSEGLQVGVVGADNKVQLRHIVLGRDFGPTVEILEGIGSSDEVILNPADSLESGATVRVAHN